MVSPQPRNDPSSRALGTTSKMGSQYCCLEVDRGLQLPLTPSPSQHRLTYINNHICSIINVHFCTLYIDRTTDKHNQKRGHYVAIQNFILSSTVVSVMIKKPGCHIFNKDSVYSGITMVMTESAQYINLVATSPIRIWSTVVSL